MSRTKKACPGCGEVCPGRAAEAGEVFLPYAEYNGKTLFEYLSGQGMKLLPEGKGR